MVAVEESIEENEQTNTNDLPESVNPNQNQNQNNQNQNNQNQNYQSPKPVLAPKPSNVPTPKPRPAISGPVSAPISIPLSGGLNPPNSQLKKSLPTDNSSTGNNNSQLNFTQTNNNNVESRAPKTKPSLPPKPQVGVSKIAQYDCEPSRPDELGFLEGDVLFIKDQTNPHWWKAVDKSGKEGLVPSNYFE